MSWWVSFYSYKGGVGRTTSLVHCALELCRRGRDVVLFDLDTEAPGIHYWLDQLGVSPKSSEEDSTSVYDLFSRLSAEARGAERKYQHDKGSAPPWTRSKYFEPKGLQARITRVLEQNLITVEAGLGNSLHIIPCHQVTGRPVSPSTIIDWPSLVGGLGEHLDVDSAEEEQSTAASPGLLLMNLLKQCVRGVTRDALKPFDRDDADVLSEGRADAAYVLVDMRTGWTLSSRVLSLCLSDAMVVVTSTHRQSVDGITNVMNDPLTIGRFPVIPVVSPTFSEMLYTPSGDRSQYASQYTDYLSSVKDQLFNTSGIAPERRSNAAEVVFVPFNARLAIRESIILDDDLQRGGAAESYRKLTTDIMDTNPAEGGALARGLAKLPLAFEEIAASRERHFDQLFHGLQFEPQFEGLVVLFGGIATDLRTKDAIDRYIHWLKGDSTRVLYICYESASSAQARAATLAMAESRERMSGKVVKAQVLVQEVIDGLKDVPGGGSRVHPIELRLPLTQYVILAQTVRKRDGSEAAEIADVVYVTPVTQRRSSKTLSIKATSGPLLSQSAEYMLHHLQYSDVPSSPQTATLRDVLLKLKPKTEDQND